MKNDTRPHAHDPIMPKEGSNVGKKEQVAEMFDDIAHRYDFLNHLLSLGIDKGWRRQAIKSLADIKPQIILDVATGTGDFALAAMRLNPNKIIGVDIASKMLDVGNEKIKKQQLANTINLLQADSEALPFQDNHFDAVTCAYGVRNFEHLEQGLSEMNRVMRSGGRLAILEFSRPRSFPVKQVFQFYFKNILPLVGNTLSNNSRAYKYLQESANAFPDGSDFVAVLERCGFKQVVAKPLAWGITTLYTASK